MKRTALLSVSDKTGLVDFAKRLVDSYDYQLLSTGGTAKLLKDNDVPVTEVSDYTGFPEMMEGRVKTLHPKIHGGLLARRDKEDHLKSARNHNIELIDLVVVNLYPFEETVSQKDVAYEDAIENIDIGGPSMLRSAAKNHDSVTVITDINDYENYLNVINDKEALSLLRKKLSLKVFQKTSSYDLAISNYLSNKINEVPDINLISDIPKVLKLDLNQVKELRYGENPHQKASLYGNFFDHYEKLHGKELSYNNIIDITAATYLIGEFQKPTVAILKHTNPCGVASGENLVEAWNSAFITDKQSPFGGIIIANQTIDSDLALILANIFCEVIIAPSFSCEALDVLEKKKNLRLMTTKGSLPVDSLREIKSVAGGILYQDRDMKSSSLNDWEVVTNRGPTEKEMRSMIFGWKIVKHVKSNAIVYAGDETTLGIGAGQMSRVDSSKIAVWKAKEAGLNLKGSTISSDAFFPFPDGLIAAADAGATAVIQPGGSVRDKEVIAAANSRNMAMIFTGRRHFKH